MRAFVSLAAYKSHLVTAWQFHLFLEGELSGMDWSGPGIDFVSRQKVWLLEQDLRVLGVPRPVVELGRAPRPRTDPAFAVGCLYVLEGATLGGQIISRHLATLGIGPANGALFFHGYGSRTGEMWKMFQAQADGYCVNDDQIESAVHGARWTFEQFRDSMLRTKAISDAP